MAVDTLPVRDNLRQSGMDEAAYSRIYDSTVAREHATILQGDNHGNVVINHFPPAETDTYKTLLESLTFDRMDARLRNVATAAPTTCTWLLDHDKFGAWIDQSQTNAHHGFLWIKGKPGSGKSTIMKQTLAWAEQHWPSRIILSYFFNARSPHELEKSSLGLYRSLSHQLLSTHSGSRSLFVKTFALKMRDNKVSEEWTETELQNFLITLVTTSSLPPLVIFIDALDEGDDDDVERMVSFLEQCAKYATTSACQLNICLSSRHYPHIDVEDALSLIVEDQIGHDHDIATYIHNTLAGADGLQRRELQRRLLDRSAGVFLWVVLVIPVLNKAHKRGQKLATMLKKLEEIPSDLHKVFDQILTRDLEDLDQCITLLQWVLFSLSPLKPTELVSAVQHSFSSEDANDDDLVSTWDEVVRYIIHCSRGLVELVEDEEEEEEEYSVEEEGPGSDYSFVSEGPRSDQASDVASRTHLPEAGEVENGQAEGENEEGEGVDQDEGQGEIVEVVEVHSDPREARSTVQFIHETVRDYLTSANTFSHNFSASSTSSLLFDFQPDRCHLKIAEGCLQYLLHVCEKAPLTDDKLESFPLARYAAKYWWQHAQKSSTSCTSEILEAAGQLLMSSGDRLLTWIQLYDIGSMNSNVDLSRDKEHLAPILYYASLTGLPELVSQVLLEGINVSTDGTYSHDPVCAASRHGYEKIVQLLLQHGAGPNTDFEYALYIASAKGHTAVVRTLLKHDADVKVDKESALRAASAQGHDEMVRILLEQDLDVNKCGLYGNALYMASAEGHATIVQALLERGANVDAHGASGTALCAASERGQSTVAQILLNHGANVDSMGSGDITPLLLAIQQRHEQFVNLLLQHHADVNIRNKSSHDTALSVARNEEDIVYKLLEHGADINARGGYRDRTALQHAVVNGWAWSARVLLQGRADVNILDESGKTALHLAIHQNNEHMVDLLLISAPDVEIQDAVGRTALRLAVFLTRLSIIEKLLEHGANVDSRDRFGATILHLAAYRESPQTIEVLLDHGAQVNSRYKGSTALDIALSRRWAVAAGILRRYSGRTAAELDNPVRRSLSAPAGLKSPIASLRIATRGSERSPITTDDEEQSQQATPGSLQAEDGSALGTRPATPHRDRDTSSANLGSSSNGVDPAALSDTLKKVNEDQGELNDVKMRH